MKPQFSIRDLIVASVLVVLIVRDTQQEYYLRQQCRKLELTRELTIDLWADQDLEITSLQRRIDRLERQGQSIWQARGNAGSCVYRPIFEKP